MKKRFRLLLVTSGLLLTALCIPIQGWAQDEPQQVEIQEYQGAKLGSVDDFRENSIKGVQMIDPDTYVLQVDGLVQTPSSFTYKELLAMEHTQKLVTVNCVEGWSVKALWEGIPLLSILAQANPAPTANTVIFHAVDGYTTSIPLADIQERNLIIADHINGIVLPAATGFPYILVAEDRWGYKWIRWLVRIELADDPDYRGFWESRGFSNGGLLNQSMFGP